MGQDVDLVLRDAVVVEAAGDHDARARGAAPGDHRRAQRAAAGRDVLRADGGDRAEPVDEGLAHGLRGRERAAAREAADERGLAVGEADGRAVEDRGAREVARGRERAGDGIVDLGIVDAEAGRVAAARDPDAVVRRVRVGPVEEHGAVEGARGRERAGGRRPRVQGGIVELGGRERTPDAAAADDEDLPVGQQRGRRVAAGDAERGRRGHGELVATNSSHDARPAPPASSPPATSTRPSRRRTATWRLRGVTSVALVTAHVPAVGVPAFGVKTSVTPLGLPPTASTWP